MSRLAQGSHPPASTPAPTPALATAAPQAAAELCEGVAYVYDDTVEGLLSAIFAAYANHEDPSDVAPERCLQPRLGQRIAFVETDPAHARRVARTLKERCGWKAFHAVRCAALSELPDAGTAAYRFVRYALDEQKQRDCGRCRKRRSCRGASGQGPCPRLAGRALSDITHPCVEPMHRITRSISQECEHMRQFIRFEHLHDARSDLWFARCNPKSSVVPLIMGHFVERFNIQPFVIYDEVHSLAGVYEGRDWYLVRAEGELSLPGAAAEEALMQTAWRRFYQAVSVESRYHPELRQHFMPKRFWRNLTELQQEVPRSLEPSAQRPGATPVRSKSGMKLSSQAPPSWK